MLRPVLCDTRSRGIPNQPPRITSDAPRFGSVGSTYVYSIQASDPEGTPLVFSLGRGPDGLTVDINHRIGSVDANRNTVWKIRGHAEGDR